MPSALSVLSIERASGPKCASPQAAVVGVRSANASPPPPWLATARALAQPRARSLSASSWQVLFRSRLTLAQDLSPLLGNCGSSFATPYKKARTGACQPPGGRMQGVGGPKGRYDSAERGAATSLSSGSSPLSPASSASSNANAASAESFFSSATAEAWR